MARETFCDSLSCRYPQAFIQSPETYYRIQNILDVISALKIIQENFEWELTCKHSALLSVLYLNHEVGTPTPAIKTLDVLCPGHYKDFIVLETYGRDWGVFKSLRS
jgi:hypothetical protein